MKKYLLIICLLTGTLTAQAAVVAGGQCGESGYWMLTDDSVFTVSGVGRMDDCPSSVRQPWMAVKSKFKKAIILEGVTHVGRSSFSYCDNLEEIEIAGSVDSLLGSTIDGCGKLRKLVFSEGIRYFDTGFLSGSPLLTSVTFPSTTRYIGGYALSSSILKEVICLARVVPNTLGLLFSDVASSAVLYVLKELIDAYKAHRFWSEFGKILPLDSIKLTDTLRYEIPVYVDVYDTVHHQVDVYDTVHTQVLLYDLLESKLYDYTVVFDTIYKTYKVWVNDYDTVTAYVTDTIYTDTIYSNKYTREHFCI